MKFSTDQIGKDLVIESSWGLRENITKKLVHNSDE